MVEIIIIDTGVGMSDSDLDEMFEPFFSRREGGTGLGMTVVKKIIAAHGGNLYVHSNEGEGTTFWLQFPGYQTERQLS